MIPLKAVFVISVLISGLILTPSHSFAQSDDEENFLSSFFEIFSKLFSSPGDTSDTVEEFRGAAVIQTSGTSSTTDTTPNNILPIADAGTNQTVNEFANVILDGSSSTDMDGTIISYNWTQISGPANVTLIDADKAEASFTAPDVDGTGIFEFLLAVIDNSSGTSTDTVRVTVNDTDNGSGGDGNILPIADAGSNQIVFEFANVILNGSSSTDPDGTITSYNWTLISGPSNVTISNSSKAEASFIAPSVNGTGIFEFLLAVVDNSSGTDTDTVQITVNEKDNDSGGGGGSGQNNLPPIADAGSNQTVVESQNVFLDGTNSTDPDGTIESYQWSQVSGPSVTLLNNNTATASFEAPSVSEKTLLQFMLLVEDNSNTPDTDTVWVTVNEKDDDSDNDEDPIDDPKDRDDQNKVTICHIPPGNPDNAHTITVGESAVVSHMAQHGDTIGPCPGDSQEDDNRDSNSGKGNSNEKSNSGKGNSNEKSNSGKGNSNEKSNSGKGNSEENKD
ncbi:MAG: hypothetical protein ACE5RG_05605 [Candidatus Nitrosomaritimum yanchengensis]